MKNLNPKIVLPIVALFIMLIQEATGLKFDATELQVINDAALSIIALSGIFANPRVEAEEEKDNSSID